MIRHARTADAPRDSAWPHFHPREPAQPLNAKNVLFYYIVCGGPEWNSTLQLQRNSIRQNIGEYQSISANIREKLKEQTLSGQ